MAALIWAFIYIEQAWYYLRNRRKGESYNDLIERYYDTPVKIEFHHIKPVALTGKIRVFNRWGNHIADISEEGAIVYISSKSICYEAEIRYIQNNYKIVWKSLEN